ncbi:MAG: S41 family peptidase [Aureliella sp.]
MPLPFKVYARLVALCLFVSFYSASTSVAQDRFPGTSVAESAAELVQTGIQFEKARDWVKAIQHYEASVREFPDSADLRRRLLISRLHYDVVRRSSDRALTSIVDEVSASRALDLFSEVLARLEMSYVDPIDLTEVIRGGTAYLEVALTEPGFVRQHLPGVETERVEQFRTSIHRLTLREQVRNRYDARALVAQAAEKARKDLGLNPTTTVVQFTLGAIGLLDPYSSFLSSADLTEMESQIEGNFVGLGIALEPHEAPLRILNVISGGPAKEAGLRAGDRILEIGSTVCVEVGAERAADLLRGPEDSNVRLLVASVDGRQRELVVARRRVEVPSVEHAHLIKPQTGVAYLKINSFQKTTVSELDRALWDLNRQGMRSLIIDLRGNPGGWLDASIAVADRFLTRGRIVSTRGKNGIENQNYDATASGTWDIPLTLLIDQESASASEILAGAIRDNNRGELIGQTTYGKGSVQGLFHTKILKSGIRLTVSKFYSPSGTAISERGVKPTFEVADIDSGRFVAKTDRTSSGQNSDRIENDRVLGIALERLSSRSAAARMPAFSRN